MKIDGYLFYDFLFHSLKEIEKNKEFLNNINVFPVKDGDTGDNLYLTLKNSIESIRKNKHLGKLLEEFSFKLLENAQGNSGNIIALFFYKIYEKFKEKEFVTYKELKEAFKEAYIFIKNSLKNPKEGTILSCIKALYEEFKGESIKENIKNAIKKGLFYLKKYGKKIKELRENKVLDAGGIGFLIILKGWLKALGEDFQLKLKFPKSVIKGGFSGYCINIIMKPYAKEKIIDLLSKKNSLIIREIKDKLIIHFHDNDLSILEEIKKYGKIVRIKYNVI